MNRIESLRNLIDYSFARRRAAVYSGFLGHRNLGDEILWDAIRDAFAPLPLVAPPTSNNSLVRTVLNMRKHRLAILGGGTLIGADLADGGNPFRDQFQSIRRRTERGIVFGTGVGALSDSPGQNAWLERWRPLLAGCEYIGVRGPASARSLAYIGITPEILGDPACLLAQDPGFWSPRERTLGVNIGPDHARVGEPLLQFIAAQIKNGWRVEFFVVCANDLPIVEEAVRRLGIERPVVHILYHSAERYLSAVRWMSAFVGVRLHSVILAMCAGVPSIMLEYLPKCHDFMSSVGLEEFNLPTSALTYDALDTRFAALTSDLGRIAAVTSRRMLEIRERLRLRAAELRQRFLAEHSDPLEPAQAASEFSPAVTTAAR